MGFSTSLKVSTTTTSSCQLSNPWGSCFVCDDVGLCETIVLSLTEQNTHTHTKFPIHSGLTAYW